MKNRCSWANGNDIYRDYHDKEWGVPLYDDQPLFEAIILDTFQAGLSWIIVLKKRDNFRKAFDGFDANKIANYDEKKIEQLIHDKGIIRNQLKIRTCVTNAQHFLRIQKEHGTFSRYIWQFVGGKPLINRREKLSELPATSKESDTMSKALKEEGFKFVGTTICYAFMQAVGMVNDHMVDCFRYREVSQHS